MELNRGQQLFYGICSLVDLQLVFCFIQILLFIIIRCKWFINPRFPVDKFNASQYSSHYRFAFSNIRGIKIMNLYRKHSARHVTVGQLNFQSVFIL